MICMCDCTYILCMLSECIHILVVIHTCDREQDNLCVCTCGTLYALTVLLCLESKYHLHMMHSVFTCLCPAENLREKHQLL